MAEKFEEVETEIGLNIIKGYIDNLGGLGYFKGKEKIGSTFTVELPIKKTQLN